MKHPPRNIDLTCFNWVKLILKTSLPSNAKYVGLYLSTYMNMNQDMAFPSLKRIEGETGLSHPSVLKYLKLLESEGWIVKQAGDRVTSNRYWVNVPNAHELGVGKEITYVTSEAKVGKEVTSNNNRITTVIKETPWDEWVSYLKQRRKTPTKLTVQKQQAFLSNYSPEVQEQIINTSITNGWQGLFPPKEQNNGANRPGGHTGQNRQSKSDAIRSETFSDNW